MDPSPGNAGHDEVSRKRKTFMLMLAGAATLLLPLIGVAYIYVTGSLSRIEPQDSAFGIFERRMGETLTPINRAAPAIPIQKSMMLQTSGAAQRMPGGSLNYVTGGSDYNYEPNPPAPAQASPRASAAPEPRSEDPKPYVPPPQNKAAAQIAAPIKRPMMRPRLRPMAPIGQLGKNTASSAQNSDQGMPPGMPDISQLMKNMPAGVMPPGGMPDMEQLMRNLPAGAVPPAAANPSQ